MGKRGRIPEFTATLPAFAIYPEAVEILNYLAEETGLSRAHHVRTAVLQYLEGVGLEMSHSAGPNAAKRKRAGVS